MASWIDSLPNELASAISESNILELLAPFRARFTATFGEPPILSSDVSLEDANHLARGFARSAFFYDLLSVSGLSTVAFCLLPTAILTTFVIDSASHINPVFMILATTKIASNWNLHHKCEQPALTKGLFEFLGKIQDDTGLRRFSATLLSQVIGGASSSAIWRSVFEVVDPSLHPRSHPGSPPSFPETISQVWSEKLPSPGLVRAATPEPTPSQPVRTHQTPIKSNAGTFVTQSGIHTEVDPRIRAELRGLTFPNTPGFMDAFFLPFQSRAAEILARPEFIALRSGDSWTKFPQSALPGPFEKWYLELANQVLAVEGLGRQYAASPSKGLNGYDSTRKPDLILVPTPFKVGASNWSDVLVVGEMKKNPDKSLDVYTIVQLANYIRIIFTTQHVRRFIHAFTFCGELMRCWVFHRGGAMGGVEFSINKDPQLFLSVILGYGVMSNTDLGFDPTLGQEGLFVGLMPKEITIKRPAFFCPPSIASRGTTCWGATLRSDPTVRYVLKDSWRSVHHGSEGEMLAKARDRGVVGIVEYIAHEDVMIDGKPDNVFENVMKGLQVGKAINLALPRSRNSSIGGGTNQSTLSAQSTQSPELTQSASARRKSLQSLALRMFGRASAAEIDDEDPLTPPISDHGGSILPVEIPPTEKRKARGTDTEGSLNSSRKRIKSSSQDFRPQNRIHTRLLTVRGRDITKFTSIRELLLAFHGAITGHRSLYRNGILHRDVSINNIMIAFPDQPRPDGLTGFLIDLDVAIETSNIDPSGAPHRTGTMEFMAIGALRAHVHTFRHDLESFFYVFLWVCIQYPIFPEPESKARKRVWKPVLGPWGSDTFESAAIAKWGDMGRASLGSGLGLERLLDQFEDWAIMLRSLARGIRDLLFPLDDKWAMGFAEGLDVYDEMLKLFQMYADKY